jgi:NSS family neurotransmitter:Na+ symporter
LSVSIADTLIAVLAGVAIFPAVFSFGISPSAGPDLVFLTLPNIFIKMAGGYFFALIFFVLLAIAALTSTISILEVVVVYFSEEYKISRKAATFWASFGVAVLSIMCSLSLNKAPALRIGDRHLFGILEYTSSNILLPLGGLFIVLFVAWVYGSKQLRLELSSSGKFKLWYFHPFILIIRYLAPVAIALVFLYGLGVIKL